MHKARVAVFTDKLDWHVEATLKAYSALGTQPIPVRLSDCRFDSMRPSGLAIPGFHQLPDLVVVRAIGDGSLEAVTMRLAILHALEKLGVRVVNKARAIEACTDKSLASFLLQRALVATPETFATQNLAQARAIARRECHNGPLVLKPLFGAQGWGIKLIESETDIPSAEEARGVFYLQRFVGPSRPPYEDMRILIANGTIVAAMRRCSSHWITNVRQGAKPVAVTPSLEEGRLALAAAHALNTEIAGVDLITNAQGAPLVLEVNSMAGWFGLQKITPFSIAERLARATLNLPPQC